jgi:hypothetical protein
VPSLRIHLKASKELLGTQTPLVHKILDYPSPTREHRYRHNPRTVQQITELLGEDAKREGWLHIFMDWGLVDFKSIHKKTR